MTKSLILCDCLGSQTLDPEAIESGADVVCSRVHTSLCGTEISRAAEQIAKGDALIACGQEYMRFLEIAEEIGHDLPDFVDLRDRAGWSDEAQLAGPKQAALAAEALLPPVGEKVTDVVSEGMCLVLGSSETAFRAAGQLAEPLSVTVLIENSELEVPCDRSFEIVAGRLATASGALGCFTVAIEEFRQLIAGGRGALGFEDPRGRADTTCDIILDLRGDSPLFLAPEKREGYLRADPGNQKAVAQAILEASQLVGTFEKPVYVRLEEHLCAHSRGMKTACTRCLDVCPTGAITPDGDHVSIDPMVCAGCGACAAVCPSAAITYDNPPVDRLFQRLSTLAHAFRKAGGENPRLLVYQTGHGEEMISFASRFGRGLPADVIPLAVEAVAGFGHAEILAAIGIGFVSVDILVTRTTERDALATEMPLAEALGVKGRLRLIDVMDPDEMTDLLYEKTPAVALPETILPVGSRKEVARMSAIALNAPEAGILELPEGAPYGMVEVNTDSCTLCLACASLCPSGALTDNPDKPQLRFQENACLQCGLCANICPENAITLVPRFDLSEDALKHKIVNEEEPYRCIECGKEFGVKSTVERIVAELEGRHWMFADESKTRMIRMCDDCRVNAQFHSEDNPFAAGDRPRPRTTDDYLKSRKLH